LPEFLDIDWLFLGRPLELDTDGIWCVLPASFPENYDIRQVLLQTVAANKNSVLWFHIGCSADPDLGIR
jgi:hypothetical protein